MKKLINILAQPKRDEFFKLVLQVNHDNEMHSYYGWVEGTITTVRKQIAKLQREYEFALFSSGTKIIFITAYRQNSLGYSKVFFEKTIKFDSRNYSI